MLDTHYHFDFLPVQARASFLAELGRLGTDVVAQTVMPAGFVALEDGSERGESVPALRSLGFHPWYIDDDVEQQLATFARAVTRTRFIGEIGLDFSPRRLDALPADQQISVLRSLFELVQKAASSSTNDANAENTADPKSYRPYVLSLHAVRSAGTVVELLSEHGLVDSGVIPVIHRFNGTSDELTGLIRLGGYISVHPSMLTSKRGRAYIQQVPDDRLVLETDLPTSPINLQTATGRQSNASGQGGIARATEEGAGASYARAVAATLTNTREALTELLGYDVTAVIEQTAHRLYSIH